MELKKNWVKSAWSRVLSLAGTGLPLPPVADSGDSWALGLWLMPIRFSSVTPLGLPVDSPSVHWESYPWRVTEATSPTRSLQVCFPFRLHPLSRYECEREQRGGSPHPLGGNPGSRIVHEEVCPLAADARGCAAWLSGLLQGGRWGGQGASSPDPLKRKPTHHRPQKVTEGNEGEAAENTVTFARAPRVTVIKIEEAVG